MALMELVAIAIQLVFRHWIYLVIAWTFGLLLYILVPFISHVLPRVSQRAMMDHHGKKAFSTLHRSLLVARETSSDHSLVPIKYDGSKGTGVERFKLGGETRHVTDELNVMGRLYGYTFGVMDERYGVITSLRLALLGQLENKMNLDGTAARQVTWQEQQPTTEDGLAADGGTSETETVTVQKTELAMADRYKIPRVSPLVDIRAVEYLAHGSCSPTDLNVAYDLTTKSQEGFWSKMSHIEMFMWMTAYLVPFAAVVIAFDQFGGAASGSLGRVIPGLIWVIG